MGRIALPARTSKPCLPLQNPPRPRRLPSLPPPPLCQHDHRCHQGPEGQEGILPPGHPQVHRCQQQGGRRQGRGARQARSEEDGRRQEGCGCCRRWQEGSRKLQAACQGAQGQEARSQEGQEAQGCEAKGCQEARSQEGEEAGQEGRPQEEVDLRTAISSSIIIHSFTYPYIHKSSWTTLSDLKFKSPRRPTFIINYLY